MKANLLLAVFCFGAANVSAQSIIFKEDFNQQETVDLWDNIDRDGDGEKWEFYNAEEDGMPAFSGGFATSWSWFLEAFTPDNTLTSPVIDLPATSENLTLYFKVGAFDEELFEEHYAVYVIPAGSNFTGTETPVFEETLDAGYTQEAKNVMVDITAFAGQAVQIVFRHYNCTDIAFIGLDDVIVRLTPLMGTANQKMQSPAVFPNPVSNQFTVKAPYKIDKVRLFDLNGRKMYEGSGADHTIPGFAPGMYILNVYSGAEVYSQKLIKK